MGYFTVYYISFPVRNLAILLAVICRFECNFGEGEGNEEKEPLKVLTICYMLLVIIDVFAMTALIAWTISLIRETDGDECSSERLQLPKTQCGLGIIYLAMALVSSCILTLKLCK